MADDSPGDNSSSNKRRSSRRRSSFTERVGFFEQIWKSARSRSRSRESSRESTAMKTTAATASTIATSTTTTMAASSRVSRVELAYHGPRTDARDRSSEDPRRHRIPRASLSPAPSPITVMAEGGGGDSDPEWAEPDEEGGAVRRRIRRQQRSYSRERRRVSSRGGERSQERVEQRRVARERSDGSKPPPASLPTNSHSTEASAAAAGANGRRSTSPLKRTQSGRIIEAGSVGRVGFNGGRFATETTTTKPRVLSFRVSPAKQDSPDTTDRAELSRVVSVTSWSSGPHTQKYKKLTEGHTVAAGDQGDLSAVDQRAVSLPPPLPDRQRTGGRGGSRQSEPALYPPMPRVEMMAFEVQQRSDMQQVIKEDILKELSSETI